MLSKFHDTLYGDETKEEEKVSKRQAEKRNDSMDMEKLFKLNMPTSAKMPQGKGGNNYASGAIAFAKLRLSKGGK